MKHPMQKSLLALTTAALLGGAGVTHAAGQLNIYNWSDYIAEDTIANFEKETGIKVTYDVYDSNEVVDAKLLGESAGKLLLRDLAVAVLIQRPKQVYHSCSMLP